ASFATAQPPLAASPASPAAAPPPLSHDILAWLDTLRDAEHADSEDYPPELRQRIFYVLRAETDQRGVARLAIEPHTAGLRKDGSIGANVHRMALGSTWSAAPKPRTMRPSDLVPLARLAQRRNGNPSMEDDPSDTMRRVLATGRARYGSVHGRTLAEGAPRPGRLTWRMREDGSQVPAIELDAGLPIALPAPWYLDPDSGHAGPVALALPTAVAARLLGAPALPPSQAERVRVELARRLPGLTVPVPAPPPPIEDVPGPPRPVLSLVRGPAPPVATRWSGTVAPAEPLPTARLGFRYGSLIVPRRPPPSPLVSERGRLFRVLRDPAAEQGAVSQLGAIGLTRYGDLHPYAWGAPHADEFAPRDDDAATWLRIMIHELPQLRAAGWEITVAPDFPIRLVQADGDFAAELLESSGIDWLELHLGVSIAGERVDLVPPLLKLIASLKGDLPAAIATAAEDAAFTLPLPDGRILSLPLGRIRPILLALVDLFADGAIDPAETTIRFTRHNAAELAALEQAAPEIVWQGGEAIRTLGRQLRAAGGAIPAAALPETFKGSLRPYQADGVNWLQFLRAAGLGGVLADDMGLGKTVQTLAHLLIEQAQGRLDRPALIVCPTSLVANWCAEAERFAPGLSVLALHGPARKQSFAAIARHDVVITTYPLLTRDAAVLGGQDWHVVVLDEAQSIKNPLATTTRAVAGLRAGQRLCLSGTPLQNHLGELWSLFDFLAPGFLGSARSFRARYRLPVEKNGDETARARLARRVSPFLLRRTKEEVAADLPPKTEIVEQVEMESGQRAVYEAIRLAMHARVREALAARGLARSGIIILDALLKLRQVCCDPRLVKLGAAKKAGSAKLDRLMELLPDLIDEGRRVLLFSQFTSMLDLIIPRLDAARIPFVLLTGDTTDRRTPIQRFQSGAVPVFLLSLKAGGTGLNLTAADTVIHYDPWWNPAVEDQATDRAHRIGQDKPVFVHRMVTLGSIEEKMEVLKTRKRALVDGILKAEQGGALRLTEADIEALFGA
ncbi:MAG: SNF2-related protein, partial [Acetobacteraceae bacterium]